MQEPSQYGLRLAVKNLDDTIARVTLETNNPDQEQILTDLRKQRDNLKEKQDLLLAEKIKDWTCVGGAEDDFVDLGSPSSSPRK